MRKILYFITLATLIIFIVACSQKSIPIKSSTVNQNNQKTIEKVSNEKKVTDKINAILEDVKLDKETSEKLNVFFSNFSEAEVPFFEKDCLSEDELIAFGIRHNIINNPKRLINDEKISSKYVEESVEKYFGKKISQNKTVKAYEIESGNGKKDVGYYEYKDGDYFIKDDAHYQIDPYRQPTGEVDKYSEVTKMEYDSRENIYKVNVNIYSYYPDMEDYVPVICDKVVASIEKLNDGRYILIDYMRTK